MQRLGQADVANRAGAYASGELLGRQPGPDLALERPTASRAHRVTGFRDASVGVTTALVFFTKPQRSER